MSPPSLRRRAVVLGATVLCALAAVPAVAATADAHPSPTPGSPGIGDRLYPLAGNGGYDVAHYALDLRYATAAPTQSIDGTVTIVALATQSLSRFDLDWGGGSISRVIVNRKPAQWTRDGDELVITPSKPLAKHHVFVAQVQHFVATPKEPNLEDAASVAFFTTPNGSATAPQPEGGHYIYPSNDHPRDKATFSFRIDVPVGTVAVANGIPTGRHTSGDRTVYTYLQRQPMATELTQIAVGAWDVTWRPAVSGIPIRDVTAPALSATVLPDLATERDHLRWMQARVGRYPFDIYGSLVVDQELGFALETQTLSLYDRVWFLQFPQAIWDPVMLHELAHQWFGDDVAPYEWSDVWLNEGHATWYQNEYAEEKGFLDEYYGVATNEELMRFIYSLGDQWRAQFGPVGLPNPPGDNVLAIFTPQVYEGGQLVLYALRQQIGDPAFRAVEREWVRRYSRRSASTADFIALASEVSGQDLTAFLNAWIYGTTTPPMPGHPDWQQAPASAAAARVTAGPRFSALPKH
jgi:aminopeptidase N